MKQNNIRQTVLPLCTALIWGTAFAAQSIIAEHIGPLTFNAVRGVIALAFLGLMLAFINIIRKRKKTVRSAVKKGGRGRLILGGLISGSLLILATSLQQLGIAETTAGKAGFITALYIVIVPVLGIFIGKKVSPVILGSVALAAAGLYFLSVDGNLSLSPGDLYVIFCAFAFAVHILIIDYFTKHVDGIALSVAQFVVVAAGSGILMLIFERPSMSSIMACFWQLMFIGVFSSGVAYTFQILAQKDANATVVALILSLESLFAALAGALFLGEKMRGREYLGCALMLVAVVLAQLPAAALFRARRKGAGGKGSL